MPFSVLRKTGVIYFTTATGELIILNLKEQQVSTVTYRVNEPLNSMYEDSKGNLWIEPESSGAIRFSPSDRSFQYFSQKIDEGFNAVGNRFRVLEDNNNIVWVNMKGGGFGYYNEAKASLDYFLNTADATNYHLPNLVNTIYYDKAGILWLSTYEKELIKIIIQGDDFKQHLLVKQDASPSDNDIRGIFTIIKTGCGWAQKVVNCMCTKMKTQLQGCLITSQKKGLVPCIRSCKIVVEMFGVGTKGNGLYKASPINKKKQRYHLTHFRFNKSDNDALQCNEIYALLEDRLDGFGSARLIMG
jgi:hypothetical protein